MKVNWFQPSPIPKIGEIVDMPNYGRGIVRQVLHDEVVVEILPAQPTEAAAEKVVADALLAVRDHDWGSDEARCDTVNDGVHLAESLLEENEDLRAQLAAANARAEKVERELDRRERQMANAINLHPGWVPHWDWIADVAAERTAERDALKGKLDHADKCLAAMANSRDAERKRADEAETRFKAWQVRGTENALRELDAANERATQAESAATELREALVEVLFGPYVNKVHPDTEARCAAALAKYPVKP